MNQPQYDSPDAEGAARLAQMAAMGATVIEALARLQAHRTAQRTDDEERVTASWRAQRLADHAAARVGWSAAYDDDWLRRASTSDLGRAWSAATTWSSTDPDAADALRRVEVRLHQLHPEGMAAYHQARARGADAGQAMQEAAQHFARPLALAGGTGGGLAAADAGPSPTRPPRAIADDAFPYPTKDGVAAAARGRVHVITTAPDHAHASPLRDAARR
jgi:hypothetical protein